MSENLKIYFLCITNIKGLKKVCVSTGTVCLWYLHQYNKYISWLHMPLNN